MESSVSPDKPVPARSGTVRMFGRYQLLRLLGKSERTMAWVVAVPPGGRETLLVLPRAQPIGTAAADRWTQDVQRASRLNHPNLATVTDIGVQDGWPYVAYDLEGRAALTDRLPAQGMQGTEVAALALQALQGLAFAHEGGVAHRDLQPYLLLISDTGQLCVAGLEVCAEVAAYQDLAHGSVEPGALRAQRDAAQRDVLALGVVLHLALTGQPALEEADVGRVIARLPPSGNEIVRLAWNTAHPVPEALRAIVNRATDRQERQRYRNARTLVRALEGWLKAEEGADNGALALLGDRLRAAGVLPSSPGAAARAARLAMMESQRTNELADVVLQDIALAFELLRAVNTAQVRGVQVAGSGPVLTVRRAIAMVGLEGVRRAALALRPWPGPLDDTGAAALQLLIDHVKRAGRLALALRPAGYDGEVVYLVALLQNLGRLVVQYHFADEAAQIRRLMMPAPGADGAAEEPGMSEEGASFAVLGADIESLGAAVARYWGLDDSVLHMIRRLAPTAPVHIGGNDDEALRVVASAANEALDALALPAAKVGPAVHRVVHRYGRELGFTMQDLQAALQESQQAAGPDSITAARPLPKAPAAPPDTPAPPAAAAITLGPGGLRAALAARNAR